MVEGTDVLLGREIGPSDGGFERFEDGSSALEGDAIEGGHGAAGAESVFRLLGYERDGDASELGGEHAGELDALP